jgi:uncharacterized protein (DUF362 family)
VSLVNGSKNIEAAVFRSIELIGGMQLKKSDHVIIKPNLCNAKNPNGMVITDFEVIKAVLKIIKKNGNDITVVESDNISGTAETRIEKSGLQNLLDKLDVSFMNLSHDKYEAHQVAGISLKLPTTVLDADYFINIPKIKTCAHTLVTLSIKNLYGIFQQANKKRFHKKLDKILTYLTKIVKTDLIVVDGLICMEGNGPVVGSPLKMGVIVAGTNPVSVDSLCSRLMGYNPEEINHIVTSAELGLGEINDLEVVGDEWKQYICEFERPLSLRAAFKSVKAIRDVYFR